MFSTIIDLFNYAGLRCKLVEGAAAVLNCFELRSFRQGCMSKRSCGYGENRGLTIELVGVLAFAVEQ